MLEPQHVLKIVNVMPQQHLLECLIVVVFQPLLKNHHISIQHAFQLQEQELQSLQIMLLTTGSVLKKILSHVLLMEIADQTYVADRIKQTQDYLIAYSQTKVEMSKLLMEHPEHLSVLLHMLMS